MKRFLFPVRAGLALAGIVLAAGALALGALAITVPPARAVELLPHRAAYHMSLIEARRSSRIIAARGEMIYEFGRRCDGWTVENRTTLRLTYEGGTRADTVWTFASWESADGLAFRFRARFTESGRTIERITGHATLDETGGSGTAWLTEPREMEIELPEGTIFPTEHVAALIATAERGDASLTKLLFDGASVDNPYVVSAEIGPLGPDDAEAVAAATGLPPRATWWARMAFFPERSRAPTPEFELGARYRADGVADRITQHFEDFSLKVELNTLEALPQPDC